MKRSAFVLFVCAAVMLVACSGGGGSVGHIEEVTDQAGSDLGSDALPELDAAPVDLDEDKLDGVTDEDVPFDEDTPETDVVHPECKTDQDCAELLDVQGVCHVPRCEELSGKCLQEDAPDGTGCDPMDVCVQAAACKSGECVGKPVVCNDGNPCTDDECVDGQGCVGDPNTLPCDDGNACTTKDVCAEGVCAGTENICGCGSDLDCLPKDDGNMCNGALKCVESFCEIDPATLVICKKPESPCIEAVCTPATGLCSEVAAVDGSPCSDDNLCTQGDTCVAGACASGKELVCDDHNDCTKDECNPEMGCAFTNVDGPCDDGNLCTTEDTCSDGKCKGVGGEACSCSTYLDCEPFEDGDYCNGTLLCGGGQCVVDPVSLIKCNTADDTECGVTQCISDTGACVTNPVEDGEPCDDDDTCSLTSECKEGECVLTEPVSCDDGNPCTEDLCDAEVGCQNPPSLGAACDDSDPCTVNDVCVAGGCAGEPKPCDDGNPCTHESCDPATGECVIDEAVNAACDDGNACTIDDHCEGGTCVASVQADCNDGNECTDDTCDAIQGCVAAPNTAECEDGDLCTKGDACSGGLCVPGGPYDCDDANVCTKESCDPVSGCAYTPADGLGCDDGDQCTLDDKCSQGQCMGTASLKCDDGDVCTDDYCDPAVGCATKYNTAPCDDESFCTQVDACLDGKCTGASPLDCDDGNPCTLDECNPVAGCGHTEQDIACSDGTECTAGDQCIAGQCVGGPAVLCDDDNPCTDDSCDPAVGCVHTNNAHTCDDGSLCTAVDTCAEGKCVGGGLLDCDDGNPCTDDACDPAVGCVHTNNSIPCDDKSKCTEVDVCLDGQCTGTQPLDCDDKNVCTSDACIPAAGCVNLPNNNPCDDADACTTGELCANTKCQGGKTITCNDVNDCTTDSCDPAAGCVFAPVPDQTQCDDGNSCNSDDKCVAGKCIGEGKICEDNNPCTNNKCDEAHGGCWYEYNTNPCDDETVCTSGDTCKNGTCVGTVKLDCGDGDVCTDDLCDKDKGCFHQFNKAPCEDGSKCTEKDTCSAGACVPGTAPDCDDKNICTADSCDPTAGCQHVANALPCDDGDACTTGDACADAACVGGPAPDCDDGNGCTDDSCLPEFGCVHVYNEAPCSDSNACTDGDVCSQGDCKPGAAVVCDDTNLCTTDSCDPAQGCVFANNALPCDDGDACTEGDTCSGGKCKGKAVDCNDKNVCTNDSCDLKIGCIYTFNTDPCDDANKCTEKDTCDLGKCIGVDVSCDDGNVCTTDSCNPLQGCQYASNTLACEDGNACTLGDKCKDTKCQAGVPKVCDDYNICTNDTCDSATGSCIYKFNPLCASKPLPQYDQMECNNTAWTLSPKVTNVGWGFDATAAVPGKLTGTCSLNYNNGTNYAGLTAGTATTAYLLDASAVKGAMTLAFHSYNGTDPKEGNLKADKRRVEVSSNGFATVAAKLDLDNSKNLGKWVIETLDVSSLAGTKFQVRFVFDSVDDVANAGAGWFIEDANLYLGPVVKIDAATSWTESFDLSNPNGWQFSAAIGGVAWAIDATASPPGKFDGNASLNFNDGVDYQPPTNTPVNGIALSPVIDLTALAPSSPVALVFRSWKQTENNNNFDKRIVEASADAFVSLPAASQLNNGVGNLGWRFEWLNLSKLAGTKFRLRFRFDSVDSAYNNTKGWFVDAIDLANKPVPVFGDGVVCSESVPTWSIATLPANSPVKWAVDASPGAPGFFSENCSLNFNNGMNYMCQGPGVSYVAGSATSQPFVLTATAVGKKLFLNFQVYLGVENGVGTDIAVVQVADVASAAKIDYVVPKAALSQWFPVQVDVTSLAGKTVRIAFSFTSVDCSQNNGVGVFVDDVLLQSN